MRSALRFLFISRPRTLYDDTHQKYEYAIYRLLLLDATKWHLKTGNARWSRHCSRRMPITRDSFDVDTFAAAATYIQMRMLAVPQHTPASIHAAIRRRRRLLILAIYFDITISHAPSHHH